MAEIHIERNERSIWPWVIIGLLAVGLLAWYLAQRGQGEDSVIAVESASGMVIDSAPATAVGTLAAAPSEVNDYLAFVDQNRTRQIADSSHDYTANGLERLAAALDVLADRDTVGGQSIDSQVTWLRQRADALQRDWRSTSHARTARDGFVGAAALIHSLQQQRFPDTMNEATAVVDAAQQVKPDVQLLEQRAAVQQFFDRAADAIRAMANTRT